MSTFTEIVGELHAGGMRAVFLFVGQGEATLLFVPNGDGRHLSVLIDCNRGPKLGGIDLAALLEDALPKSEADRPQLDLFVNTHPHCDHFGGLAEIRDAVDIAEVWHSGHKPGPDHAAGYEELKKLVDSVSEAGGEVVEMLGSRTARKFGDAHVNIISPAKHVCDDIDDEEPDERRKRIHEQCGVLRFSLGDNPSTHGVLITGDSDRTAWEDHITDYHGKEGANRIAAKVMSASHHGSYTFFRHDRDGEDEESYTKHLERISPTDIIISAPDARDSPFDHPHQEALDLYKEQVGDEGIHHMGSRGWSFVADFMADGGCDVWSDNGDLKESFGLDTPEEKEDDDDDGGNEGGSRKKAAPVISRVEKSRPMG